MVFLTPHSPEIWTCLLGRIMDHADLDSFQTLWLWYFTIRKQHGFWLWYGCEEETSGPMSILETKKKSLWHKLITFLESTTVSHTIYLSMRQYWLTLNTKMTSCMFKESTDHSRTTLSFVLFPLFLWTPSVFFDILSSPTVDSLNLCFS